MLPLPTPSFDAFISYSHTDLGAVSQIANRLKDAGLSLFFDRDTILAGDRFQQKLEAGLQSSRSCVVFIGPTAAMPWQASELEAAIRQAIQNPLFRVIPVLLPGSTRKSLPIFLGGFSFVEYTDGLDDREILSRLISGIRGTVETGAEHQRVPSGSLFARRSTRELFEQYSELNFAEIDYHTSMPLTDLARLVKLHHPELPSATILENLSKARESVYDAKYADRTTAEDERFISFDAWQDELEALVLRLGVEPTECRALVVGVGNGNERPKLYRRFKRLTICDISPASLRTASRVLEPADTRHAAAEDLAFAKNGDFDLYISLRTFQSSFFNIRHAAFEANRALRRAGVAIISIPNVYVGPSGIGKGLESGDGGLDPHLSWSIADAVRRALLVAEFDVGIQTGRFEIYVTGKKLAP
jgi:SAM-dependent methyltransferase